jgi:hypothetical protein
MLSKVSLVFVFILIFCSFLLGGYFNPAYAQPTFKDSTLKAELIVEEYIGFRKEQRRGTSCFKWYIARRASSEVGR